MVTHEPNGHHVGVAGREESESSPKGLTIAEEKSDELARLITHNPKLRSEYFQHPGKVLARAIPRQGPFEYLWPIPHDRVRARRARLGDAIEAMISKDPRLVSAREAYFEKNVFLDEALRNPQKTFDALVWLSILAFTIGAALLLGAFAAAVLGEGTAEKAVLGGLSGGGGAATTLLTVFLISRETIRRASGDNAQMRLILTAYATEITHFRAIPIETGQDAEDRNKRIRKATAKAVGEIEAFVEPKMTDHAAARRRRRLALPGLNEPLQADGTVAA